MKKEDIIKKIDSFPTWAIQFDLDGNLTPVLDQKATYKTEQRKDYFFDPIVDLFGGSLKGKRVLDIACNAGYWSLQAINSGCDYVVGIDGRKMHTDQANFVFDVKGIDKNKYDFVCNDVFTFDFNSLGEFDVVICLGFFHHISKQMLLLEKISEINTDLLILETRVSKLPGEFMSILYESTDHHMNSLDHSLTMLPTKKAVIGMLKQFNYESVLAKPQKSHMKALMNYKKGRRRAFICSKKTSLSGLNVEVEKINRLTVMKDIFQLGLNWITNKLLLR